MSRQLNPIEAARHKLFQIVRPEHGLWKFKEYGHLVIWINPWTSGYALLIPEGYHPTWTDLDGHVVKSQCMEFREDTIAYPKYDLMIAFYLHALSGYYARDSLLNTIRQPVFGHTIITPDILVRAEE